jgi:hypothetical protein
MIDFGRALPESGNTLFRRRGHKRYQLPELENYETARGWQIIERFVDEVRRAEQAEARAGSADRREADSVARLG